MPEQLFRESDSIHRTVIKEPAVPRVEFNVDQFATAARLEGAQRHLDSLWREFYTHLTTYCESAYRYTVLFGHNIQTPYINSNEWSFIVRRCQTWLKNDQDAPDYVAVVRAMKLINGRWYASLMSQLRDLGVDTVDDLKESLAIRKHHQLPLTTAFLLDTRLTYPELAPEEEVFRRVKDECNFHRSNNHVRQYAKFCAHLRLCSPKRWQEVFDVSYWPDMCDGLATLESVDTDMALECASYLAIIAADDIVIDDQGLRLVNKPKNQLVETSSLPQERSY